MFWQLLPGERLCSVNSASGGLCCSRCMIDFWNHLPQLDDSRLSLIRRGFGYICPFGRNLDCTYQPSLPELCRRLPGSENLDFLVFFDPFFQLNTREILIQYTSWRKFSFPFVVFLAYR